MKDVKYPGDLVTTNGNQLVAQTEARISDCGVFFPITPSTEQGENFETSATNGTLTVFGESVKAIETEGEHAAQGGAIAVSTTGKRVSNFTSGQGIVYGLEQYYHAPGKLSTMILNVGARALTKHALNVHCGHDDVMSALDTGWIMLMAKDAQQACDQSIILRRTTELSLTPGINIQDGFLTTHLERTFLRPESGLLRDFLGRADDEIKTPTQEQKKLFGDKRRRVPIMYNLNKPVLLGPVQNQEHYMTGVISRGIAFNRYILQFLEESYKLFGELTGRSYGLVSTYNCQKADTVFLSLGSSAENIEAGVNYIAKKHNDQVGVIHLNCIRPFPERAVIEALRGKKNVIILERTDEPNSGSNPIARDVRTALSKALENSCGLVDDSLPSLKREETPRIFEGVYGLGSRDFRPEHIIGAWEYVREKIGRTDGSKASDGKSFFYLGTNHPYSVVSKETPSLLPESAIAVRIHSIGGWGAITTGKNMAEILGQLSTVSKFAKETSDQVVHISANPKYGSEKKGAPTNYFLVAAREKIRVNCDLKHVDVVLCCDPKAFTHTNPLSGLKEGGSFVWESNESTQVVWSRIPSKYRQEIIDKKIKLCTLAGFDIAKAKTPSVALQTRMQGNSFLGAFFKVSPFLNDHDIDYNVFLDTVLKQYKKKFGRFGEDVVASNLEVMKAGYEGIRFVDYGKIEDADRSTMKGDVIMPKNLPCATTCSGCDQTEPVYKFETFEKEFYVPDPENQKATPITSLGMIPVATGEKNNKFVSRIDTPVYNPYDCTACMACINICPDTALPNTAQDLNTLVKTVFNHYISDEKDRSTLVEMHEQVANKVREQMQEQLSQKKPDVTPFAELLNEEVKSTKVSTNTKQEVADIVSILPLGYGNTRSVFQMLEKKNPGSGGLFSIFVSDKCKGCGECVKVCPRQTALSMVKENDQIRGNNISAMEFFKLLPNTPPKFLGQFDPNNLENVRAAVLQNHLMVQSNYDAIVSGDGSCAGCGEKSVLRGIATVTEALMAPLYEKKVQRLRDKVQLLRENGVKALEQIRESDSTAYQNLQRSALHLIMGLGGDSFEDTKKRIANEFKGSDKDIIDALVMVMETDANNHRKLEVVDGNFQGMSVMGMTSSTGCNSVYGSTTPTNPHTYPWMNSLFQDSPTIGWMISEGFMQDHARRSVLPERIANLILEKNSDFKEADYHALTHFDDTHMTDLEILELPKVWAVGGDGAMGDIGFQNASKVMTQNRPNMHILMLDTQVYSNTGGQNSDSSVMPGGFDMNQYSEYHEGKLTERKEVAQIFTSGHGSPFVACVSMANIPKFYKAVLDGLMYRGGAFIQSYTSCQPEHGIADDASADHAKMVRDSRSVVEFSYDPKLGELESECFDLKGNPRTAYDWSEKKDPDGNTYEYIIPHWAACESRFRKHFKKLKPEEEKVDVNDLILRITQKDITYRNFLDPSHRSFIPQKGVYVDLIGKGGKKKRMGISRMMVLFTVERRKNWRRLQDKAGIINKDYQAQKLLLKKFDANEIEKEKFLSDTRKLHQEFLNS